ncbi:DNA methyltransferase [Sulfitobacter sp. R18_1]|uniref:class I SAM-dependent DNA methyltransferase n=1 Tax=Sulfitobacter sp. R18_1 TaxID=2821104 RepID=UPI001ADC953E|nr:DNA methyltransferase [Sulfitobacter sp. R18_1]MBO9428750.1 class I SAM-dependent DNA methyltransferase [Sulfitobacter sp. R18_1]
MNITEIETAVSDLAAKPFDQETFFFDLITAYGAPSSTVERIRTGSTGKSDVNGAVLWTPKIHYVYNKMSELPAQLDELAASKKTTSKKVRFLVATDGEDIGIRDTKLDETSYFSIYELAEKFGTLLPVAGFERYSAVEENPVDVKASSRLAKFYDAIIKENPEWATDERRHDMNQFMTRMIFCFFAEDTGIFPQENMFAKTLHEYGGKDGADGPALIERIFTIMATSIDGRAERDDPPYIRHFPYVNGGLFSGSVECPVLSKTAWQYLREAGDLDWAEINPDIFGSMLQAVVDPKQRHELGMHYTSVPNIMKVLGPLFLDDYKKRFETAGRNRKKLRDLLRDVTHTRVFDPACGSGNFLVIAYRELRILEERIETKLGELNGGANMMMFTHINLENFYGIEIDDFAAETAKLALWIAEYQANKLLEQAIGRRVPSLPLRAGANIHCGNALRIDWAEVCPKKDEYLTYVAGNPPFLGSKFQDKEQKSDMMSVFDGYIKATRNLDFVACWFLKGSQHLKSGKCTGVAFVSTNSICQGDSVPTLWPHILDGSVHITFAHRSFKWSNNASKGAAVSCVVVGLGNSNKDAVIYDGDAAKDVSVIGPYLTGCLSFVTPSRSPISSLSSMVLGATPRDGGNLILTSDEKDKLISRQTEAGKLVKDFVGSQEWIKGNKRYCIWITDDNILLAQEIPEIADRLIRISNMRSSSSKAATRKLANVPHRFEYSSGTACHHSIVIPRIASERRKYIPVGIINFDAVVSMSMFAMYDAPIWNLSILSSRLHREWIGTVCGRLKTDLSYSNTLGWNTFPVPALTDVDKADLEACARGILEARDMHPTKTLADLYDPDRMPDNLRAAHERNDEVLEKIYIGRRFKNDTERLDHLFERYEELTKDD